LFNVDNVVFAPSVTAELYVCVPVVVTDAAAMVVVPEMERDVSADVLPTNP